jgi:uncharacterized protein (DUF1330 family)
LPYYTIVGVSPTSDAWIPGYLAEVGPLVAKHGGRYLARTASHTKLEGDVASPGLMVLLEWPSKQSAEAFYADPSYQPHLQARLAGASNMMWLVEGKDDFAPA